MAQALPYRFGLAAGFHFSRFTFRFPQVPRRVLHPFESPDVEAYGRQFPVAHELFQAARATLALTAPDAEECMKWDAPCYLLNGLLCTVHPHAKGYVDIHLARRVELLAELATTAPVQGKGEVQRRLRVMDLALLERADVLELLHAAAELNRTRPRTKLGELKRRGLID